MKSLSVGSLFLLCFLQTQFGFAQNVGINVSGLSPNTAAILDIDAAPNFNKGLLIPRVTFSQRTTGFNPLSAAAQGLTVYQTDAGGFGEGFYFNTSTSTTPVWSFLLNSNSGWSLTGNAATTPSSSAIGTAIAAGQNYVGTSDLKDFVLATNNLERLRITANGNVGIGISAPAFTLDVNGGARALLYTFPAPTGDPAPVITARTVPSGQGASAEKTELILFHSNDPANAAGADQITLRAPALSFQTFNDVNVLDMNNNVGYNERMYINSIGNVGIGTIAPQTLLHLTRPAGGNGNLIFEGNSSVTGAPKIYFIDITGAAITTAPSWMISNTSDKMSISRALTLGGTYADFMNISNTGNIGIGTNTPSTQLHSTGGVRFQILAGTGTRIVVTDANGNLAAGSSIASGIVTGSGILNYVPKWTPDGATLGNSLIFDNGTNVGIGTAGPGNKFGITISSNDAIPSLGSNGGSFGIFKTDGATPGNYGFIMGVQGSGNVFQQVQRIDGSVTAYNLLLQPSGGNVGIGTSSPGAKLHAYMIPSTFSTIDDVLRLTSKFESTGNAASAAIGNGPAIVFSGGIGDNQTRDRARIVAVYEGSNVSGLAFHTQNTADIITEKMRIQNNGNVGIGTTAPSTKFEIWADFGGSNKVSYTHQGGGESKWWDGAGVMRTRIDATDPYQLDMFNSIGTRVIGFTTDGGNTFINSGNVGIGTSSPGAKLHAYMIPSTFSTVDDVLRLTSKFESAGNAASAAIGNGPAIVFSGGIGDNQTRDRARIVAVYEGSNVSGLAFHTQNTADIITEKMRIQNNGNVGIGTVNPAAPLEVQKSGGSTSSVNVALILDYESSTTALAEAGTAILFRGKSSGGNIANYNHAQIRSISQNTNNAHGLAFDYKPNAGAALTEAMRIGTSGNIGIGATAPTTQLHTTGGVRFQTLTGTGNRFVITDLDGNISAGAATTAGIITGSGTLNYVPKWTPNGTTLANSNIFDNGTNVGIGTSTFGANGYLQVAGDIGLSGVRTIRPASNSDSESLKYLGTQLVIGGVNSAAYGYANGGLIAIKSNADGAILFDAGRVSGSAALLVSNTTASEINLNLRNNAGASVLFSSTNTGNLGIGTTTPGAKVDIRGNDFYLGPYANTPAAFVIYEAEDLNRTGGATNTDATASNGNNWGTNANFQLYGPYRSLPIGNYKFVARVKVADASYTGNSFRMTVIGTGVSSRDRYIRGVDMTANNEWNMLSVPFRVTAVTGNTVEVYVLGVNSQQIYTDYIMIVPDADSQTEQVWGNFYTSGNIGIGTNSPGAKLEIAGQIKITGGAPGAGKILTSDAAGLATWNTPSSGSVAGSGTLNYVPKWTPDGVTLGNSSIFDNGNVGIGTTNPVGKLHIAGAHANGVIADGNDRPSAAVTGVYPQMVMMAGGSGNTNHGATLMLGSYDAGTSGAQKHWSIGSSGVNSTFLDIGYSATDINPHSGIRNYNGSTFMTILNSGNVGIGTTAPAQLLHVYTTIADDNGGHIKYENANTGTGSATNAQIIGKSKYGTLQNMVWENYGARIGMRSLANSGAGDVYFTSGADAIFMVGKASGNVGIGTTTPIAKLDVNSNINITGGVLPRLTGASSIQTARNVLGTGLYNYQTYNDPNAPTTYGAAVGFGNGTGGTGEVYQEWTSPYRIYHRALRDCCENWSGWIRMLDINDIPSGIVGGSGTINYLARWTSATTLGIGATFDNGTNVGIGTTSPATRLHLWNTSADNELRMTADGSFDPIFRMTGEGGSTGEGFTIQYDNSVGDTYIKNIYNTTNAFHFQTASQEAMTIKTNGDIGIGTTNPVGKLHIAGAHANGVMADGNDRPSAAVTGVYPQMVMMAGGSGNTNHGATLMLGSYDAGTSGAQKHWSIGSSGVNSTFLDIGYSAADINPHSGIRNYNGSTFMTILNSGNVGIGTTTPAAKLEVNGDFIRTIARAQGYNQADGTDNGAIATRTLTFVKKYGDTGIRVTYSDGRRVLAASTGGRWEVKFNAASCPTPGPIAWDIHSGSSGDYHRADATVGTCFGLPAGTYTIQIYVGPTPGYPVCDLYTGWIGLWSLEAEEVR